VVREFAREDRDEAGNVMRRLVSVHKLPGVSDAYYM
jgi:hypothetical protein